MPKKSRSRNPLPLSLRGGAERERAWASRSRAKRRVFFGPFWGCHIERFNELTQILDALELHAFLGLDFWKSRTLEIV